LINYSVRRGDEPESFGVDDELTGDSKPEKHQLAI
jgi:hypothetical protein